VLGTNKPPFSLVVLAALLRERGVSVRLADLTATGQTTEQLIAGLEAESFTPSLVVFPSTTPTLASDAAEMAKLKARSAFPCSRSAPTLHCAQGVDGEGPPGRRDDRRRARDGVMQIAQLDSLAQLDDVASLTYRRDGAIVPHKSKGAFAGFNRDAFPAWDLLPLDRYTLPLEGKPYVLVETSRGCPYTCDFCVAPILQGHKSRTRRHGHRRRDCAGQARARRRALLPVGRYGHVEPEDFSRSATSSSRATWASSGSATRVPTT